MSQNASALWLFKLPEELFGAMGIRFLHPYTPISAEPSPAQVTIRGPAFSGIEKMARISIWIVKVLHSVLPPMYLCHFDFVSMGLLPRRRLSDVIGLSILKILYSTVMAENTTSDTSAVTAFFSMNWIPQDFCFYQKSPLAQKEMLTFVKLEAEILIPEVQSLTY